MTTTSPTALEEIWTAHRKWSLVANAVRAELVRDRRINLFLLVVGAALAALASQSAWLDDTWQGVVAIGGALVLLGAWLLQNGPLGPERIKGQTAARAMSEVLKAETYRYLAKVEPYDGANRDTKLRQALADAAGQLMTGQNPITATVRQNLDDRVARQLADTATKPPPTVTDIAGYENERARGQATWHRGKADQKIDRASWLRGGELAATAVGAVIAMVVGGFLASGRPVDPDLTAWVGLATTVGAALAAHLAATRSDKVGAGYRATATALDQAVAARASLSDAEFVRLVESILAQQNQSWITLLRA